MGGLAIAIIVEDSNVSYTTSRSIMEPLTAVIVIQQLQQSPDTDAVNEIKNTHKKQKLAYLNKLTTEIDTSLDPNTARAVVQQARDKETQGFSLIQSRI